MIGFLYCQRVGKYLVSEVVIKTEISHSLSALEGLFKALKPFVKLPNLS